MSSRHDDAIVVGAGPNGLAAAIVLARAGISTRLVEAASVIGGGMRSSALTLPGYVHDECSAVHPLGLGSPFFSRLPLARHGLTWIDSPTPLAHVLDDGRVTTLERSIDATCDGLGVDGRGYRRFVGASAERWSELAPMILGPLRWPRRPLWLAAFGARALWPMSVLARLAFREDRAPALLGGIAAHAMVPLDRMATSSFALVLAMAAHAVGWPVARGGSGAIAEAMRAHFVELGGTLEVGRRVTSLRELPPARAVLFDVAPRDLTAIAGEALSARYRSRLARFRHAAGVFKVDWALRERIPWRDARCTRAVTVHLSPALPGLMANEDAIHRGIVAEEPLVIVGQPSLVDGSRAPDGHHTVWAYAHVPRGSRVDLLDVLERRIERHAPGFRDLVLARRTTTAAELEAHDPSFVGGDISGGMTDLAQLFFRPVVSLDPYATSAPNVFLCSSSTPPGGGVHGMCGYWAARSALRRVFGRRGDPLDEGGAASRG